MVQRKVTNKHGIQADQLKTNKLLATLKRQSSSLQHQDVKNNNKAADLTKKMKKSRPPFTRNRVPQPGKPPPPAFPKSVATSPQKKSPATSPEVAAAAATPNYMKSTTSSDARKEQRPQVSSRNLQTLFDSKNSCNQSPNRPKIGSGSVHKTARTLARTSSLKLMRTLTKTTSFKPARASAKKCSPLVLTENMNVRRATCSSTLKDSKFPAYLELSSGGTESVGTSVLKVCPYTYCSLNGHLHRPSLPPLKSFISARRRMLKAQKGIKLGCESPLRSKPVSNDILEGNLVDQMIFDKPSQDQEREQEHRDFFVQIYIKEREAQAEITEIFDPTSPSVDDADGSGETAAELEDRQVLDILFGESPFSETDSIDEGNENGGSVSVNMEADECCEEVKQNTAVEESRPESLSPSDNELRSREIIPMENTEFGFSAFMDWETENYDAFSMYLDCAAGKSYGSAGDFHLQVGSNEFRNCVPISISKEAFDERSVSSKGDPYHDFEIVEYIEGSDNRNDDQLLEMPTIVEEDGAVKPEEWGETISSLTSISLEKAIPEPFSDGAEREMTRMFFQDGYTAEEIRDLNPQDFHDMIEESSIETFSSSQDSANEAMKETSREELDYFGEEETRSDSMDASGTSILIDILGSNPDQESADSRDKMKWKTGSKRFVQEHNMPREFNPRGPNFLPVEPDPEAEKVDLKHQMMDERKNADEWMLDYAIQQAVTKLGPARKRKVALLVEAFETVMPVPRYEPQLRPSVSLTHHARSIQACS